MKTCRIRYIRIGVVLFVLFVSWHISVMVMKQNDGIRQYFGFDLKFVKSKKSMAVVRRGFRIKSRKTGYNSAKDRNFSLFGEKAFSTKQSYDTWKKTRLHYYEQYKMRAVNLSNPGELGKPVTTQIHERDAVERSMDKYGVNIVVSDRVSLERHLPDHRSTTCQNMKYEDGLPRASCILLFSNEAKSLVLRTVHSIVNRTPPELLAEVILVDDASTHADLGAPLDEYISEMWPEGFVKILRLRKRHGLMKGRNAGARVASGEVIVVMDAHVEVTDGWLEPLLSRIKLNRRELAIPLVPMILPETLQYTRLSEEAIVTTFLWNLEFTWIQLPRSLDKRNSSSDPIRSPTMIGCVFAMDRKYFFEIGGFDEGMDVWGGENIELPIRVWLCGGTVHIIPCSRVGHVYRAKPSWNWKNGNYGYGKNLVRLAETWLDEYKDLVYFYRPDLKKINAGNLTKQLQLKQKMKCKNFKWFLTDVVPFQYIPVEHSVAYGQVRNVGTGTCMHLLGMDNRSVKCQISLRPCIRTPKLEFQYQVFSLSKRSELRRELDCLQDSGESLVKIAPCLIDNKPPFRQQWIYDKEFGLLVNRKTKRCLDSGTKSGTGVKLSSCDHRNNLQQWTFQYY